VIKSTASRDIEEASMSVGFVR